MYLINVQNKNFYSSGSGAGGGCMCIPRYLATPNSSNKLQTLKFLIIFFVNELQFQIRYIRVRGFTHFLERDRRKCMYAFDVVRDTSGENLWNYVPDTRNFCQACFKDRLCFIRKYQHARSVVSVFVKRLLSPLNFSSRRSKFKI